MGKFKYKDKFTEEKSRLMPRGRKKRIKGSMVIRCQDF
jgi:hypothetical protein